MNSGWKRPQGVYSPASWTKQSRLWGWTRLLKTSCSILLKTFPSEDCIAYQSRQFFCLHLILHVLVVAVIKCVLWTKLSNLTEKQAVNFFTVVSFPLTCIGIFRSCYYHYNNSHHWNRKIQQRVFESFECSLKSHLKEIREVHAH